MWTAVGQQQELNPSLVSVPYHEFMDEEYELGDPLSFKTIAFTCLDPRFIKATEQYVKRLTLALGLGGYTKIIKPGGALDLIRGRQVSNGYFQIVHEHFPAVETVLVIGHTDCLAYKKERGQELEHECDLRLVTDLLECPQFFFERYPKINRVYTIQTTINGNKKVVFERPCCHQKPVTAA